MLASLPPFISDICFLTVFISLIDAPDFKRMSVRIILSLSMIDDGGLDNNADAPL